MAKEKSRNTLIEETVLKNLKFRKDVNECWTATFVCADGYSVAVAATGNARVAKSRAKQMLVDRILEIDRSETHQVLN